MNQCINCGTYSEALERVWLDSDGEYVSLCEACLPHINEIFPENDDDEMPESAYGDPYDRSDDPSDMSDGDYAEWLHGHGAL